MKFIIADEIKKTGIPVQGVLIKGTKNKPTDSKFEDYKAKDDKIVYDINVGGEASWIAKDIEENKILKIKR